MAVAEQPGVLRNRLLEKLAGRARQHDGPHAAEQERTHSWWRVRHSHEVIVTLLLVALAGAAIAVVLVWVYLGLNVVVIGGAPRRVATHPQVVTGWATAVTVAHGSPPAMTGIALLIFPKPALGRSGFETGVAVMPHIEGPRPPDPQRPAAADHRRNRERGRELRPLPDLARGLNAGPVHHLLGCERMAEPKHRLLSAV
ncbi:hypothetical protein ACWT_3605 [Actinoplanes sp. SE50]|uniref:hypothetical protein n=1 Tax=unclassified Actinoplanes TaxID=2626549 RepID=UPI00023EC2B4|nr:MULTISPECIES: hypothetical protein [unclassified Actinoplanes]AEV84628.1 hypothetical protein ACPL_3733 [Actinoplanes sp. SE50/110]ATO83020.1 hypothetical protein ACWT_3605 [Actinoplanes sp. SE50]SLM00428.1 hypothetical protein ACSP50_3660 [Actinoplanes sp. SE50/110]